jgi:hypothetical protein
VLAGRYTEDKGDEYHRCGGKGNGYRILLGNLQVRKYLEDLGVDGKIIL